MKTTTVKPFFNFIDLVKGSLLVGSIVFTLSGIYMIGAKIAAVQPEILGSSVQHLEIVDFVKPPYASIIVKDNDGVEHFIELEKTCPEWRSNVWYGMDLFAEVERVKYNFVLGLTYEKNRVPAQQLRDRICH